MFLGFYSNLDREIPWESMPKLKSAISHYLIELPNFGFQYQKEDARVNEIFKN